MRLMRFGFVVGCFVSAWLASVAAAQPTGQSIKPQEELQQLLLDFKELKGLVASVNDRALRERMEKNLQAMEGRLGNLQKALRVSGGGDARKPIADAEFQKLLAALKKEAFDDSKVPLVKESCKYNWFTCAQAAQLVKLFTFSNGQRQAAIALHPRLTDPGNFQVEVLSVFTFGTDKDQVRKALGLDK